MLVPRASFSLRGRIPCIVNLGHYCRLLSLILPISLGTRVEGKRYVEHALFQDESSISDLKEYGA